VLLFWCVCLLFARRRVGGGWSLAYPGEVEGGGCDVEVRVVLVMGATCVFQAAFVVCVLY